MAQKQTRYQQIADDLRRRVESDEWDVNTPLPTETDLMTEYAASRNTVREAVRVLVQQHKLETRAGQGTFITPKIVPFVTRLSTDPRTGQSGGGEEGLTYPNSVNEQGRDAGAATPEVTVLKAPPKIAERLQIEEGKRVVSRFQQRYIDGTIWSLQTSYYPLEWVQRGAEGLLEPEDIPEGTVNYLAKTIGLKQAGYRDLLSARLSNDKEQDLFDLTPNHTVIEVYRTSFTDEKKPIRVTVTVYPSDRNQLVYDLGTVPDAWEGPVPL
jgi:GntR family transcriptional regulator